MSLYNELHTAWLNAGPEVHPGMSDADLRTVKQRQDFWKRCEARIRSACARVELDHPKDTSRDYTHLAPGDFVGIEEHLKGVLDLAPPSKPAREVLRPLWPNTLAQLAAMVAASGVKQNPAPLLRSDKVLQPGVRSFSSGRALYHYSGAKPDAQADYDAVDGIAWRLSAPEGFPPIPRRGGVYSPHEAGAIDRYVERNWQVLKEARAIARAKDREVLLAGINPLNIRNVLGDYDTVSDWLEARIKYQGTREYPTAAEKSPKEYVAAAVAWGARLLEYLDAVKRLDPKVFDVWADPDAHMVALESNPVTQYAMRNAARTLYHLPSHTTDWSRWLGPAAKSIHPSERVLTPSTAGYGSKHWPLSELIHARQQADDDYNSRTAAGKAAMERERAHAVAVLTKMLQAGKQFNRANIERALPGYHFTEYKGTRHYSIGFRGPTSSAPALASGMGSTIGGAMADIQQQLGLLDV